MLIINGTEIFVDDRGPHDGPPLLYIHGGPGQSCWDFMTAVGDELANRGIRVIGVDQRGVLRSGALATASDLSVPVLIEDFEEIRVFLDLEQWSILGHSAGGAYALDYCLAYPSSITAAVFDCPCWDADATDRSRLPIAAKLLEAAGKDEEAAICRAGATLGDRLGFSMERLEAMQQLGPDYLSLFFHNADGVSAYGRLTGAAPADLDWERGSSHLALMDDLYRDRVPSLRNVTCRSLLIHGEADLVAPPEVVNRYRDTVLAPHEIVTLERAGHFAFVEQSRTYVEELVRFIRSQTE